MTAISTSPQLNLHRARKSLGQHFLVDQRILGRIVAAAELAPEDVVVEVGPGRGALTRQLLPRVEKVLAVELDSDLAEDLPRRTGYPANLSVHCEDARTLDLGSLTGESSSYKVVANLPYYAASPIIRRFLECDRPPARMVVTVQREVADSMVAQPGKMSLLSVGTQYYADARIVCEVSPSSFRPIPKVSSAVVRLDVLPHPAVDVVDAKDFFDLVRAGFSAPRKQLRNSLGHGLRVATGLTDLVLERAQIDGTRRPGTVSLEEWAALYRAWRCLRPRVETEVPDDC